MGLFSKKKNVTVEECDEVTETSQCEKPEEEWVWVKGYKGTEKDMTCRGYQFEMDKQFDISDDRPVEICEHGFHLCLTRGDVYNYYPIGEGHRFFRVTALVRKGDLAEYGSGGIVSNGRFMNFSPIVNKLVAKSIIFTSELTVDEILEGECDLDDWTDEEKKNALVVGVAEACRCVRAGKLRELGYSEAFAWLLVRDGKYDIAKAVGSQTDLSMDMKVWIIFND